MNPDKKSVLAAAAPAGLCIETPQSQNSAGSTTEPPTPSSMGSSTLSAEPNEREKEQKEILTMALEGHENLTKATGAELAQRKSGP